MQALTEAQDLAGALVDHRELAGGASGGHAGGNHNVLEAVDSAHGGASVVIADALSSRLLGTGLLLCRLRLSVPQKILRPHVDGPLVLQHAHHDQHIKT